MALHTWKYNQHGCQLEGIIKAIHEKHEGHYKCVLGLDNKTGTLELSSNSKELLVRSWLFCIQNLPQLVSFLHTLGGSVEV